VSCGFCYTSRIGGLTRLRIRPLPTVQDDWRAWLPQEKAQVFDDHGRQLELVYVMLSVALDEAIGYRRTGMLAKSYQAVSLTPDLAVRLAENIGALLRGLGGHAKHYGTIPNAAPLDSANFHGPKEQRTARMSDLLSRVLLTQRSQFLHKIATLEEMVGELGRDFRFAVENLDGSSANTEVDWQVVDAAHYDLNTCLREAIVLLKSFLMVLPVDQVAAFEKTVQAYARASEPPAHSVSRLIRHRRMTAVGGE
jgi:hypothetical protein